MKIIITYFLILSLNLICYGQKANEKKSGIRIDKNYYQGVFNLQEIYFGSVESFHFRDSVKSVTTNIILQPDAKNDRGSTYLTFLKLYPYIEFDKFGNLATIITTSYMEDEIFKNSEIIKKIKNAKYYNYKGIRKYNYETSESDIIEKNKYSLKVSSAYPAFDGNMVKLNTYLIEKRDTLSNKTVVEYFKYDYEFNDNGTINNEKKSIYCFKVNELNFKKEVDSISISIKNPTYFETYYLYDANDKLICQDIKSYNQGKTEFTDSFPLLDGEYFTDANINYYYDEKERLNKVVISYPESKLLAKKYLTEEYFYNIDNNISKVIRYIWKKVDYEELIYNSNGDITNVNFTLDNGSNEKSYYKNQIYEYEYDKKFNWTKCKKYIDEKNQNEPILIIERKIEYFNE